MKIKDLTDSRSALGIISQQSLPAVVSYQIGMAANEVDRALKPFFEARDKKMRELGKEVQDKDGSGTGDFTIKSENLEIWKEEFDALLDKDVEIVYSPIKLADLGDIKLPPAAFSGLGWLITN